MWINRCMKDTNSTAFTVCKEANQTDIPSSEILQYYDISWTYWQYILPLIAFAFIFRILGYITLRFFRKPFWDFLCAIYIFFFFFIFMGSNFCFVLFLMSGGFILLWNNSFELSLQKLTHVIYKEFLVVKIKKFHGIFFYIFNMFAQNIDCGYTKAVLTCTHNQCFGSKIRKIGIPL